MTKKHLLLVLGATGALGFAACDRSGSNGGNGIEQPRPAETSSETVQLSEVTLEVLGMT